MATYLNKFNQEELEQLSLQARYYYDEADDGKQEKGKVFRDSMYSYKALIPNVMCKNTNEIDLSKRLPVEPVIRRAANQCLATVKNTLLSDQVHSFIYRSKKEHIREEVAKSVTNRVNDILLRENDGDKIFTQAFKEAIITGDSFVKYFIEENKCISKGEISEPMPMDSAELVTEEGKIYSLSKALKKYPDTLEQGSINLKFTTRKLEQDIEIVIPLEAQAVVEAIAEQRDIEVEFNDEFTTISHDVVYVSGEIELVKIEENVVVEFVPFQDIYVDRYLQDVDITKADYVCHRIPMARHKAHERFEDSDEESLELLQEIDTNVDYPYSNYKLNTQNAMSDGYEQTRSSGDDMLNNVFVYEHYFKWKCPETKKYELMQVCSATRDGRGILEINKVKQIPFVHYSAFPMNTSFWSESIHDYLYDEQVRQTTLLRSVSTNAEHTSKLRFLASNNMNAESKRALLDNRPGGVVFTDAPTDVTPMPTHPLSQAVIEGLRLSQQSIREEWSSSVGQDLIDKGSNMSATGASLAVGQYEMKDKAICKNLSVGHVQLAMGILSLLAEDQQTVEVKMDYTPQELEKAKMNGVELPTSIQFPLEDLDVKGDFIPDVNTPDDLAKQAMTHIQGVQFVAQYAPQLLTPANIYNAVDKVYEASSIYDTSNYVSEPETAPLMTNEQIQEMQAQLSERATAQFQAEYDKAVAESRLDTAKATQIFLENRQYLQDKEWSKEKDKVDLSMKSQELRADIRNEAMEEMLDVVTTQFQMDRAVVEALLTNKLGKNVKLGSYQI